jgi:hypothetical protein
MTESYRRIRGYRSILDSLNHPNVVMLYDKILDKEEQKIYIVMEVSRHQRNRARLP